MSEVFEVLGQHPFFFGMSEDHLQKMAACASAVEFVPGQTIFHEGAPADVCYLVLDGDVALELTAPGRGPHVIQTLHAGDILGWSWLFPPFKWSFDAQSLVQTSAIRFDAAELRAAKEADLAFGYDLLKRFAEVMVRRLQAARLQLLDIYADPR
ncbi:MAG: cyclic nucleotide-binding domain-containing protein [Actinomycetota bacterium]|nr:cyclic nucleotide-binding domain-containing protein [Actinomycetota bacterium]